MKRLNNYGFSLIELMIVVAIIGILTLLAIPNLLDAQDRAKQRATVGDLRGWGTALAAHYTDRSVYPPTGPIATVHSALVPYSVSSINTRDHWRNNLLYESNETDSYTIQTPGKDGLAPYPPSCVTPSTWQIFNLPIVLVDGVFVCAPV